MAEFSKQWCDLNDTEMPWDFDILEEDDDIDDDDDFDDDMEDDDDDKDDIYGGTVTWKKYDEIVK